MHCSSQVEPFLTLVLAWLRDIDFGVFFVKGVVSGPCDKACILLNIGLQRSIRLYSWINRTILLIVRFV
jgi:hypothetical protein